MLERLVLNIVLGFILRQVAQFREETDWEKIDSDLQERIAAVLPGTWFDGEGRAFAHTIVVAVQGVLSQADCLDRLLRALAFKRFDESLAVLKELLQTIWAPNIIGAGGATKDSHLKLVSALDVEPSLSAPPEEPVQPPPAPARRRKRDDV